MAKIIEKVLWGAALVLALMGLVGVIEPAKAALAALVLGSAGELVGE